MPPKKRQEFDLANMDDYQQLFETQQESATARIRREQEIAKKRRKLLNQSAILTVGPKFRDDQITRFRGTNSRVIQSEAREDGTLFDSIVDDVTVDTIRAYDDCDIMLTDYINPESPKLISILLKDMNPDGEVDPLISRIPVPLYICLTAKQMYDIAIQYGLDVYENAFSQASDISALPISLIPCNRGSGYRHHAIGKTRPCRVEGFINEVIGRMDRLTTNNSGNWDTKEKYFQAIEFKFRVGPRNSVAIKSIRNVQRGQKKENQNSNRELTQQQRDQYVDTKDMDSAKNAYDGQEDQWKVESEYEDPKNQTERDKKLDEIGEDGTSHAAMLEWRFQLTTHVLMSPQLQAAFVQVSGLINKPLNTHGQLEPFLKNPTLRGHLTTLLEYEMLQGESSLRVYTDPRAQDAAQKRRMYSAYCLRNER